MTEKTKERRVLLLGADAARARTMAASVRGDGLAARAVFDAGEAVRLLKDQDFEALVVDARLAKPPALQLLAKLRQASPALARGLWLGMRPRADARGLGEKGSIAPCAIFGETIEAETLGAFLEKHRGGREKAGVAVGLGMDPALEKQLRVDYAADDMVSELARIVDLMLRRRNMSFPLFSWARAEFEKLLSLQHPDEGAVLRAISTDAGVAARLLRDAGEALGENAEAPTTLSEALGVLGRDGILERLRGWLESDMAESRIPGFEARAQTLWLHCMCAAQGARLLAKSLMLENPERFYLAGLLHDIGKWAIIECLEEGYAKALWTARMVNESFVDEMIERFHCKLGGRLAEDWRLPEPVCEAVREHNDDERVQSRNETTVVVYFANLMTRKIGYSSKRYDDKSDPLSRTDICRALNIDTDARQRFQEGMVNAAALMRAQYAPAPKPESQ